jgi:hypothetical protein
MNDRNLKEMFSDCVLPVACTRAEVAKLKRYYELRRTAPNWNPRVYGPNNHKSIDPQALANLLGEKVRPTSVCAHCGKEFMASRTTARYCSESCKQRAKRKARSIAA